jgi:TonB family protein
MRGALRACYKRALDEDPNMHGTVRVTASIAPNGEVKSVQPAASGLSSNMVACVTRVVRGAQFSAPEGGGATLVIPMTFVPQ